MSQASTDLGPHLDYLHGCAQELSADDSALVVPASSNGWSAYRHFRCRLYPWTYLAPTKQLLGQ